MREKQRKRYELPAQRRARLGTPAAPLLARELQFLPNGQDAEEEAFRLLPGICDRAWFARNDGVRLGSTKPRFISRRTLDEAEFLATLGMTEEESVPQRLKPR